VLGRVLGIEADDGDAFVQLVQDIFSSTEDERRLRAISSIVGYFTALVAERRVTPGQDLISGLLHGEDVPSLSTQELLGTVSLLLVAGVDTAASVLGSALWHLATHDADRRRLLAEPELMPAAVEELLRAYAPATMARIVTTDLDLHGQRLREGDRVLLCFPAANRDEEAFADAERVLLDRTDNRHLAFGSGIHRCLGAHLARMELRVALEEWLCALPSFCLDPGADVEWTGGQARGPRTLPLVWDAQAAPVAAAAGS
jgi:cytochrome P450